jgi:hypothetical protein
LSGKNEAANPTKIVVQKKIGDLGNSRPDAVLRNDENGNELIYV